MTNGHLKNGHAQKRALGNGVHRGTVMNGHVHNGTIMNGDVHSGTIMNGNVHHGSAMNGDVPVASGDDGMTKAKKALFHIGEELQEKVTALVNSATMSTKSSANDNVSISLFPVNFILIFICFS